MDQTTEQPTRQTGVSPSKGVMEPEEAMQMARKYPARKILVSEGHAKYGARVKANDIRTGKRPTWKPYTGEVRASAIKQPDGTYNVYVYVNPDDETAD